MDDRTQEIDVFDPETARLGQAQADERAEYHGRPTKLVAGWLA